MKRLIAGAAVAAALAIVPSALGGGVDSLNVKSSKSATKSFKTLTKVDVKKGKNRVVYFRVQHTSSDNEPASVRETQFTEAPSSAYKIDWFKGKKPKSSNKITSDVRSINGYFFQSEPGDVRFFSVKFTNKNLSDGVCLRADLGWGESGGDQALVDFNGPSCIG